jgi:hypothetical protein
MNEWQAYSVRRSFKFVYVSGQPDKLETSAIIVPVNGATLQILKMPVAGQDGLPDPGQSASRITHQSNAIRRNPTKSNQIQPVLTNRRDELHESPFHLVLRPPPRNRYPQPPTRQPSTAPHSSLAALCPLSLCGEKPCPDPQKHLRIPRNPTKSNRIQPVLTDRRDELHESPFHLVLRPPPRNRYPPNRRPANRPPPPHSSSVISRSVPSEPLWPKILSKPQ